MTTLPAQLEVNDALQLALSQGSVRIAVQLEREEARVVGLALIEYAAVVQRPAAARRQRRAVAAKAMA